MTVRNISITFHTDVSDSRAWFRIPRAIARLLGVRSGDVLAVTISKPGGELIYHGLAKMDSLTDLYRAHIGKPLKKGEEVRVSASLPPAGTVVNPNKLKKSSMVQSNH